MKNKKTKKIISIILLIVLVVVCPASVYYARQYNNADWQISTSGEFITPPGKESSIEFVSQNGYSFGTARKIIVSDKTNCVVMNSDGEIAIVKAYDNGRYEISYYGDLAGSYFGKY